MSKIKLTEEDIIAQADEVREWAQSPDGKALIKAGMDRAKRTAKQIKKDREVTDEQLRRRFTI